MRKALDKTQLRHLNTEALRGVALVDGVTRLCAMNLLLHGVDADAAANVLFFDRKPASESPWTTTL